MADADRRLTTDDLDACEWQLSVELDNRAHRFGLAQAYFERSKEADARDDPCRHVYWLLSTIMGLSTESDDRSEPFVPQALLGEINADDLSLLAARAPAVRDADLRARIRDLSWVVNRDYQAGQDAIGDYLTAAEHFYLTGVWFLFFSRLRRALGLAKSLGNVTSISRVVAQMESFLDAYNLGHEARFLARDLMELLLDVREGDLARQAANAERIAQTADAAQEWDRAIAHWQMKAKFDERRDEAETARLARAAAAASLASQAHEEAAQGAPWTGVAATHLLEAMKMYRDAGEAELAQALHAEALALQRVARSEAQSFSIEPDFTEYIDLARASVRGKELVPALASLATITSPTSVTWLRELTEEEIREYPFQHWIQQTIRDDRGRAVARRAMRGEGDEANDERALRADMLQNADWVRGAKVLSWIEPARHQLMLEHQPRLHHLLDVVAVSPFVLYGRETLFARGLLAGLQGDFLLSTHLLVPQLEHAIRAVFEQHGVVTSTLVNEDIQENRLLGALLQGEQFQEAALAIFGEDLVFDLRGVLVERWGANLRNRVAHGLMDDAAFSSVQCCYAWWLTLRLVMWPHLLAMTDAPDEGPGADAAGASEQAGEASR